MDLEMIVACNKISIWLESSPLCWTPLPTVKLQEIVIIKTWTYVTFDWKKQNAFLIKTLSYFPWLIHPNTLPICSGVITGQFESK